MFVLSVTEHGDSIDALLVAVSVHQCNGLHCRDMLRGIYTQVVDCSVSSPACQYLTIRG